MSKLSRDAQVLRVEPSGAEERADIVAAEEPLEIRLAETPLAVLMRTPGHDEDLVRGFFLSEGIVLRPDEIASVEASDASEGARITVVLAPGVEVDPERFKRNMFVSSSCGICGKASIESVQLFAPPPRPFTIDAGAVAQLTDRLREQQPTFDETGGLHAAGLFTLAGEPTVVREDVGRHNAIDKALGAASQITSTWPLSDHVLVVSGRQSFEVVQKAAMAGVGGVAGVSAPTSLAVELAEQLGMLLIGFARGDGFNVYAGRDRLTGLPETRP